MTSDHASQRVCVCVSVCVYRNRLKVPDIYSTTDTDKMNDEWAHRPIQIGSRNIFVNTTIKYNFLMNTPLFVSMDWIVSSSNIH